MSTTITPLTSPYAVLDSAFAGDDKAAPSVNAEAVSHLKAFAASEQTAGDAIEVLASLAAGGAQGSEQATQALLDLYAARDTLPGIRRQIEAQCHKLFEAGEAISKARSARHAAATPVSVPTALLYLAGVHAKTLPGSQGRIGSEIGQRTGDPQAEKPAEVLSYGRMIPGEELEAARAKLTNFTPVPTPRALGDGQWIRQAVDAARPPADGTLPKPLSLVINVGGNHWMNLFAFPARADAGFRWNFLAFDGDQRKEGDKDPTEALRTALRNALGERVGACSCVRAHLQEQHCTNACGVITQEVERQSDELGEAVDFARTGRFLQTFAHEWNSLPEDGQRARVVALRAASLQAKTELQKNDRF